ncbi:hypothetical protein BpHYR1_036283 [Brachionus plicatilis]|uniref:Uncharacterized protein n=1 Tax=Brachionus plicatilis TaxID=10195 RepID=A0A3M7P777_BRAPC|nr:hypothetical protein BpHYR1_036283 [Brachionus plicatilis]
MIFFFALYKHKKFDKNHSKRNINDRKNKIFDTEILGCTTDQYGSLMSDNGTETYYRKLFIEINFKTLMYFI